MIIFKYFTLIWGLDYFSMHENRTNFAITIPLSGNMLQRSKKAWSLLNQKFGVNYISSRSLMPHIDMEGGMCIDDFIQETCRKIAIELCPITLRADGLGVFVRESPVIYIRWRLSGELKQFRENISSAVKHHFVDHGPFTENDVWLPISTLAKTDTEYDQLSELLHPLRHMNFEDEMIVSNIDLVTFDNLEQKLFARYPIAHL